MKAIISAGVIGIIASAALIGCGSGSGNETTGEANGTLASVELALTNSVPAGVQCIKVTVTVAGQTVTPALISTSSGQSEVNVSIGQLPAGAATFQAWAYNLACASVTGSTTANWVADPASASLVAGYVSTVPLNFRQNNNVAITANFSGNVSAIYTSANASYARMGDGTVMQWGATGFWGQWVPTPVASLTNVAEVAGGNSFACARKTDGTVWCWGYNRSGAMGPSIALGNFAMTPVQITGFNGNVSSISAGTSHVCAVANGYLYCWGNNAEGELGTGNTTNSSTPLASRSAVGSLSAGANHTCITDGYSGNVLCTGLNNYGQLGNNSTTNSTSFVYTNLSGAIAVYASGYHTCVLGGDNLVRCFGINNWGNLGDGTTTNRLIPTLVSGLANVQQLQTGYSHNCALVQGGTVSCWGAGLYIGTGQTANQLTPVTIPGLSGVLAVHTNQGSHTCVELSDHSVKCWGANDSGQIGDGSMAYIPRPLQILF